jgi:hypothetical protein
MSRLDCFWYVVLLSSRQLSIESIYHLSLEYNDVNETFGHSLLTDNSKP